MNEFITGYLIDNDRLEIGPIEFNMSIKGIREVYDYHIIGRCERHVEKQEYSVIHEKFLYGTKAYCTTILRKDGSPDIMDTVILIRTKYGKAVSLDDADIELIDGNISIMNTKLTRDGYATVYMLQTSDRNPQDAGQQKANGGIVNTEKVY